MLVFIIFAIAIALGAIVFALQNPGAVIVQFFVWQTEGSLAVVLLVTLAIGVLIGLLVCTPALIRRSLKISSQQRQIDRLEGEIQARRQDLSSQTRFTDTLEHQLQERLNAFGAIEPVTGLVTYQHLPQVAAYLLKQMQAHPNDTRYRSLSLLLIRVTHVHTDDGRSEVPLSAPVTQAIAQNLKSRAYPETWLHADGRDHFACVTSGLTDEAATNYGEMIRAMLNELSVDLANGTAVKVDASLGGAMADLTHPVDSAAQLIDHAEQALTQSQERGRDRFAWFRLGLDRLMWN